MCEKTFHNYFYLLDCIPFQYKPAPPPKKKKMCNKAVSKDPFLVLFDPDKYITQKVCDEAVDDCLAALKVVTSWLK